MKRSLIVLSILFTMILLNGCISIPTGDGESIGLSKDGVTIKTKDGEETTITGDVDDGSISIQGTDADGNKTSFNSTTSEEIPDDFPDSIPIPKEAVIKMGQASEMGGSHQLTVIYEVENDDIAKYDDLYREYANEGGYEIIVDSDYGDVIQLSAQRDNELLTIMIEATDTGVEVALSLMISAKE